MSEAEWLACEDPSALLTHLEGRVSSRKLRLVAVAFCRRTWPFLIDERSRKAVEALERHADEPLPSDEWEEACRAARLGFRAAMTPHCNEANAPRTAGCAAAMATWKATLPDPLEAAARTGYQAANAARRAPGVDFMRTYAEERQVQSALVRDIFGNPFRAVTFDPAWRTSTAVALAQVMYESRDFGAMPILADALQDAGCDNEDILTHCRGDGPHVRGCWVVDLVLGKE